MKTPAVFLDRDGTLMTDVAYCAHPAQVAVFPGARRALERLKAHGYFLTLVTNQSGLGRGYFSEAEFALVQAEFFRQLGTPLIDAAYHCPDAPEAATPRRKPGPGMLLEAAAEHDLDLGRSFLIGDSPVDLACGRAAGLAGVVLVRTGRAPALLDHCAPDFTADDLSAAVDWILSAAVPVPGRVGVSPAALGILPSASGPDASRSPQRLPEPPHCQTGNAGQDARHGGRDAHPPRDLPS